MQKEAWLLCFCASNLTSREMATDICKKQRLYQFSFKPLRSEEFAAEDLIMMYNNASVSDLFLKRLEPEDLSKYIKVSNPRISPDSEKICFTVTKTRLEENRYESNLWLANRIKGNIEQLTSSNKDHSPVWSPDGKQIAFVSKRILKEGDKGDELWIINIHGGEAKLLRKVTGGISNIRWSPDGQRILFLSNVPDKAEGTSTAIKGLPIFRNWPSGLGLGNLGQLFVLDLDSDEVKQLTQGDIEVFNAEFSNKGDKIAYIAEKTELTPTGRLKRGGLLTVDIFVVSVEGGTSEQITKSNLRAGPLTWSPDDSRLAFRGCDLKRGVTGGHENIFVISSDGRTLRNLTLSFDRSCKPEMPCDVTDEYGSVQGPVWKGDYIYFLVADGSEANLYRIHSSGEKIKKIVQGDISVASFSMAQSVIAYTGTNPTTPTELWVTEKDNARQLTNFNDWVNNVQLAQPEHNRFTASDGTKIEGWIMKPLGAEDGKKYPAILYIHGGPQTTYGKIYCHEFQVLAAKGYFVLYANPRGSEGYSEEFKDVRGHYGEGDYRDLMEFVDDVVSNYDIVDLQRMGVTGGSYGGFMTNWIITQTDRFKAAVTKNSVSNWMSWFGTSDIGWFFGPESMGADFGADIWTIEEKYLENSPIRHMKNVKTPTLVIHPMGDYRCFVEQALQFYTGLQYLGVESELVLVGGPHGTHYYGDPHTKIERIQQTIRWFERHLKV